MSEDRTRVVLLTQNAPVYLGSFMEMFLSHCQDIEKLDVVSCVVMPPLFKSTFKQELLSRYHVYGLRDFMYLFVHALKDSLKDKLWSFGVRNSKVWPKLKTSLASRRIKCLHFEDLNQEPFISYLKQECDILVSIACPKILRAETLQAPRLMSINYHTGALPRYRGRQPLYWALLNREEKVGITVHEMVPKLDAGPLIVQEMVDIRDVTDLHTCYLRTLPVGAKILAKAILKVKRGDAERLKHKACSEKPNLFPSPETGRRFRGKGLRLYP